MAPHIALAAAPDKSNIMQDSHMAYACTTCSRRKVKCDRLDPICSSCSKHQSECIYEAPVPRRKKRKVPADIHEKLRLYEDMLLQSGLLNEDLTLPSGIPSPADTIATSNTKRQRLAHGLSGSAKVVGENGERRYLDSFLYKLLQGSDQQNMWPAFHLQGRDEGPDARRLLTLFGPSLRAARDQPVLEVRVAMQLWHIYIDRVEPGIKVLHQPTIRPIITETVENQSTASLPHQCLTWAILHFAILSLTDPECRKIFPGQSRDQTADQFREVLQGKLQNADLLCTSNIHVLQAFIILLLSVRGIYEAKTLWILTGVAFRLAQSMGLHRDGEKFGLSHFDAEINRRIFWQLPHLDGFSAQISGTGIMMESNTFDVRWPGNFNDDDLHPQMKTSPEPQKRASDMIWWLTKAELVELYLQHREWDFLLRPRDEDHLRLVQATCKIFDEKEDLIESKYLRYIDATNPIHLLCMYFVRGALQCQRFRMYLPYAKVGLADDGHKKFLTDLGLKIVEQVTAMFQPMLSKFAWHAVMFTSWDILIWLISELMRAPSYLLDPDTAWIKLNGLFEIHPELINPRRAMAVAISKLAIKAWNMTCGSKGKDPPSFIIRLQAKFGTDESEGSVPDRTSNATAQPAEQSVMDVSAAEKIASVEEIIAGQAEFDNGIETETVDWEFWDQLLRDPDLLRPLPV